MKTKINNKIEYYQKEKAYQKKIKIIAIIVVIEVEVSLIIIKSIADQDRNNKR